MPEIPSDSMVDEVLRLDRDLQEAANERRAALCVPYIWAIPEPLHATLLPLWEGREEVGNKKVGSPKFYERILAPLTGDSRFVRFKISGATCGALTLEEVQRYFDIMLENWKDPNLGVEVNAVDFSIVANVVFQRCDHPYPYNEGLRCEICNRKLK